MRARAAAGTVDWSCLIPEGTLHLLRLIACILDDALQLFLQLLTQRRELLQNGRPLRRIRSRLQLRNQSRPFRIKLLHSRPDITRKTVGEG